MDVAQALRLRKNDRRFDFFFYNFKNTKFINNRILLLLKEGKAIESAITLKKITNWTSNDDAILLLLQDVKQSNVYRNYIKEKVTNFEKDKQFIIDLFTEVIAPNEKLYNYLEDRNLTWIDDLPVVNTAMVKILNKSKEKNYDD